MLIFNSTQKIYLAVEPVDMRKQFNGLWAMAAERLSENPYAKAIFLLTNKKDRVKILFLDGTGVWVYLSDLKRANLVGQLMRGVKR